MTNNLITLTIPNDDHVALRAFGKALEEMALAHGAPLQVKLTDADVAKLEEAMRNATSGPILPVEVDTTTEQFAALAKMESAESEQPAKGFVQTEGGQFNLSTGAQVDSTGTPWDERIHSASKALNADGTWRLRRKPKDMDDAEWGAYLRSVADELVSGSHGSDAGGNSSETEENTNEIKDIIPAEIETPVTPPGDDFHTDAGVVTEQTVAGIPPIPVPPPVTTATLELNLPTPPHTIPVTVEMVNDWDFPKLMKFLTERHGKIDVPTVNQLLAVDGLAALTDLNANPDKIGQFVARVKAHLGE